MTLGENIYRLRSEKNMSQLDLADALEVSRQSVSKWENDSAVPELEKLMKMAKLFEVSLDELVGNTPPAPTPEPAPAPAPAPGITTGDLISVILLFIGIITPILVFVTGELHGSTILFFVSIFAVPPLVTFIASKCSPKNKVLRNAYFGFNLVIAVIVLIACAGVPLLGLFLGILYLIPIFLWPDDTE